MTNLGISSLVMSKKNAAGGDDDGDHENGGENGDGDGDDDGDDELQC